MKKDSINRRLHRARRAERLSRRAEQLKKRELGISSELGFTTKIDSQKIVNVYHFGEKYRAYSHEGAIGLCPKILSFRKNPHETIAFINDSLERSERTAKPWKLRKRKGNQLATVGAYYDFANIEEISTSVALTYSSHYLRTRKNPDSRPSLINVESWKPQVVYRLAEIGFFEMLGIKDVPVPVNFDDNLKTLRFFTGSNASVITQAEGQLRALAEHIDPNCAVPDTFLFALNSAFQEAMINVSRHAYGSEHEYRFPHKNQFFFTGAARRDLRQMTFSVYDHGATIPVTYPRADRPESVKAYWKRILPFSEKLTNPMDGAYIATAVKYGNSQTGEEVRGKGLPQIKEAIDRCEAGSLMIISRSGQYIYEHGKAERFTAYEGTIGGTLITWEVVLPS